LLNEDMANRYMSGYIHSADAKSAVEQSATLIELLRHRALNQPDRVGFTFLADGETETDRLTYQELDQQAQRIAVHLRSICPPGSRALLLYPFSATLEFIAAFFGCLYAGIVAVPTYAHRPHQPLDKLQSFAEDAQATLALTVDSLLSRIEPWINQNASLSSLRWLATDRFSEAATPWQEPLVTGNTLSYIQYTSGSTGRPKGVMITHQNILHNSAMIFRSFGHTPESRGVIWLPLHHDMGLIGGVVQPIYGEFPVVLIPPGALIQKPVRWLQAISRYRATTSGGPNFAYEVACQRISPEQRSELDLSSWEVAFNGAEPVRAETLERFAKTFASCGFRRSAFYPCYGMAETTSFFAGGDKAGEPTMVSVDRTALERGQAVSAEPSATTRSIVSCGRVEHDQTVAIVDPASCTGRGEGQIGEIWLASPSLGKGYWNRLTESEQAFHAYRADTGAGPFFRTGDLGFLQDGELFITGRQKEMIIIWGRNHYPHNIEQTVEQSHPALQSGASAAFSLAFNGEEQLGVAQEVDRRALRTLDGDTVILAIRQMIAVQHGVDVFAVVLLKPGQLPKTSSGKVKRHACREQWLAGQLDVVGEWRRDEVDQRQALQPLVDSEGEEP
jgi:acyl-CoA synthetase (AMP-forming)/AMP-acid ligase II